MKPIGVDFTSAWLFLVCLGCAASPRPLAPGRAESEPAALGATASACGSADVSRLRFGLVVLGSGGPRSFGRAASGYVVVVGGRPRLLIDAGPGTFLRLGEMELELGALDTVLLTHLHIDHAGELPGFVKARDLAGDGPMTFRIAGPTAAGPYPSTTTFVERLFGAQGAFAYLPSFRNVLRFDAIELAGSAASEPQPVLDGAGLSVKAIAVDHGDVPAVAYRVEHAGHSLVVSGDLASKNDNLVTLATGADLLVYDTSVLDPPGSTEALYDLHTPPARIGEVATRAQVRTLLLSHLTARVEDHANEVMSSVQAGFRGEVRFAHDCLTLELAAP